MKVRNLEPIVLNLLQEKEITQTDDFILYGCVLRFLGVSKNTNLFEFLKLAKKTDIPSFESVTRCRRKVQEKYPELKNKQTSKFREEKQEEFKQFSKE